MIDQHTTEFHAPNTARQMTEAARAFVASLSAAQRGGACFPFIGDERFQWQYTPGPRGGLRLKDMSMSQRAAAMTLCDIGLSLRGAEQARGIIALEPILAVIEEQLGEVNEFGRDSEAYYFSVFGEPGAEPWGWRANGHHLALNFTVVGGVIVTPTPLFYGANPAEVRQGPSTGLRMLAAEEDLARTLLHSLDATQQQAAVVDTASPGDIITRNNRQIDPLAIPLGINFGQLDGGQRDQLVALIRQYTERLAPELSGNAWQRVEGDLNQLTFAWAGGLDRGQAHYYAIKGPTFLIEYDNTQNNANHIHTVWRDFTSDWGLDLLAAHYATDH